MVLLSLVYAIVGEAESVFDVEVDDNVQVCELKKAIRDEEDITVTAGDLKLFLAKKDGEWLQEGSDSLDTVLLSEVGALSYTPMPASWKLNNPVLFGPNVLLGEGVVHVLVVVPDQASSQTSVLGQRSAQMSDAQQSPKKLKIQKCVAFAGPVGEMDFSVPLDTISSFQRIKESFSGNDRPLYLLYGPRQFGKTTIAKGIERWLRTSHSNVICLFFEVAQVIACDATKFWNRLAVLVDAESNCRDFSSFMNLVARCTGREKKVCLVLDKMDYLFDNPELLSTFLQVLRMWKAQSAGFFLGFIGVGSYNLANAYKIFRGRDNIAILLNVYHLIKVTPFTPHQMTGFFKLIEPRCPFPASLQSGIMMLSGGAPGVLGSLIRFTLDEGKWKLELDQWERWFLGASYRYLQLYNHTYHRIQLDLHQLNDEEWWLLKRLLGRNEDLTAMDKRADRLLRMGVVIEVRAVAGQYALAFVSPMMRRVCLEALPAREISETVTAEDPGQLLSVALAHLNPSTIAGSLVRNRNSPSEAVFHFELYAVIRDILDRPSTERKKFVPELKLQAPKPEQIFLSPMETDSRTC